MKNPSNSSINKTKFIWLVGAGITLVILIVTVAILFLGGKQVNKESLQDVPTLGEAKQELHAVENELTAFIPQEVITQIYPQTETSKTLFECESGSNRYYWPGSEQVDIKSDTDSGEIMSKMHDNWASKSDWTVKWVENDPSENIYHLDLTRKDGLHLAVMNLDGNTNIHISGFTRCFELDNYNPNLEY